MLPDIRKRIKLARAGELHEKADHMFNDLRSDMVTEWLSHPVTHAVVYSMQGDYEEIKDILVTGDSLGSDIGTVGLKASLHIGKAQALEDILDLIQNIEREIKTVQSEEEESVPSERSPFDT